MVWQRVDYHVGMNQSKRSTDIWFESSQYAALGIREICYVENYIFDKIRISIKNLNLNFKSKLPLEKKDFKFKYIREEYVDRHNENVRIISLHVRKL